MVISLLTITSIRRTATLCALFALCTLSQAVAETLIVPTDFSTIQAAIDRADSLVNGPTPTTTSYSVLVEPGTYPGGIILKPNIPLRGRETGRTILNGGGTGSLITAANVNGASVRNFTFRNAAVGISISGIQRVTVENNVFSLGTGGVGVQVSDVTNPTAIINNTFTQNQTAIMRAANTVLITNNIFSNNTTNIGPSFAAEPNITYNTFDPDRGSTEPRGSFYIPNGILTNPDPLFADEAGLDLHLTFTSPCKDNGDPSILDSKLDGSRSDMGAYGGPNTDAIPSQVKNALVTATTASPYAITVTWTAATDYAVAGYKVYYGNSSGNYSGNDAVVSGVTATSPVDAGTATSILLSGLTASSAVPAAPVLNLPSPLNGQLVLSWTSVPGATSYTVHYGIVSTAENTVDAGNAVSVTLSGLTNGQTYKVAVSAISQAVYYIAVTAYDANAGGRTVGVEHESAYSSEKAVTVGTASESGLSNEVTGMPEPINALPNLPNTGCFIATAAYGSPDNSAVQVLRTFRDRYLATNAAGSAFIDWYYAASPAAAGFLNRHPSLKPLVRALLAPAVALAFILTQTSTTVQTAVLLVLAAGAAVWVRRRTERSRTSSRETTV